MISLSMLSLIMIDASKHLFTNSNPIYRVKYTGSSIDVITNGVNGHLAH